MMTCLFKKRGTVSEFHNVTDSDEVAVHIKKDFLQTPQILDTEEYLKTIFDSFFRGSNVGNRAGSGVGLYICRKLMNKMGGDIYAESEGGVMKVTVVLSRR